ncbi:MAG: methyl-accepting chemotaxis protein [Planctomycetota bacterium]|jgi:methyl-accepting chemotaxis protein|nr:methyl-accepting chemotaxis protein [Planctomycetota bacterium]
MEQRKSTFPPGEVKSPSNPKHRSIQVAAGETENNPPPSAFPPSPPQYNTPLGDPGKAKGETLAAKPPRKTSFGSSIASYLLLAFSGVTLISILVSLVGLHGLEVSLDSLLASRNSFQQAANIFNHSTQTLINSAQVINNANQSLDNAVNAMHSISSHMDELNELEIPSIINSALIRETITNVTLAERTLMLHQYDNRVIRKNLHDFIKVELAKADQAINSVSRLVTALSPSHREHWRQFILAWNNWLDIHQQVMQAIELIEDLLQADDLDNAAYQIAFNQASDLTFGKSQLARAKANENLKAIVDLVKAAVLESREKANRLGQETLRTTSDTNQEMDQAAREINDFQGMMTLVNHELDQIITATNANLANSTRTQGYFLLSALLGLFLSLVLAFWQARMISKPLHLAATRIHSIARGEIDIEDTPIKRHNEIGMLLGSVQDLLVAQRNEVRMANRMASGDFTVSPQLRSPRDQLGLALVKLLHNTNYDLKQVGYNVRVLFERAEALSIISNSLSKGAKETSKVLEDISTRTRELQEQSNCNANNIKEANQFAISSHLLAERGYTAMGELVTKMQDIRSASEQIAKIVKLIDDISFQTNLLSFNATVEAARAGWHGRGFSVVAEEVRRLASRSAKAARETAELIKNTTQQVENGVALAVRTDHAFKEILDNVQESTKIYGRIAAASSEQSANFEQISQRLIQIDQSTQMNYRYAADTATSAQTIYQQSGELSLLMDRFRLTQSAKGDPSSYTPLFCQITRRN